jgi:hypothetical protein
MGVNNRYKDSVFTFLFSDPAVLRELYCALEGVSLPPDVPVTINTLGDVLFMERVNDISFTIGDKQVILIEHQSTINPNMALRLLMYIARVYEKILGDKNIYSTKAVPIPRPEFFVLYNGTEAYPDEAELKLSDAFESGVFGGEPAALELIVRVININEGRNEAMVRRSEVLRGYSAFIAKVREYEQESGEREEALKKAVRYCREHDILKGFLERNGTEVMNMLITEWNWDDAKEVWYTEGLEEGLHKGLEEGLHKGLETGREEVARKALSEGVSVELVQKITGLDVDTLTGLLPK